jgi:hypothetical protein
MPKKEKAKNSNHSMWTIAWRNAENEDGETSGGWDSFNLREDIVNLANTLVRECNVSEDDIIIFPPKSGKHKIPYDEIETEGMRK